MWMKPKPYWNKSQYTCKLPYNWDYTFCSNLTFAALACGAGRKLRRKKKLAKLVHWQVTEKFLKGTSLSQFVAVLCSSRRRKIVSLLWIHTERMKQRKKEDYQIMANSCLGLLFNLSVMFFFVVNQVLLLLCCFLISATLPCYRRLFCIFLHLAVYEPYKHISHLPFQILINSHRCFLIVNFTPKGHSVQVFSVIFLRFYLST